MPHAPKPTTTPAHNALAKLETDLEAINLSVDEHRAATTTVRDLLLDGDEAAWLVGFMQDVIERRAADMITPGLPERLHAKANKIAGFTS